MNIFETRLIFNRKRCERLGIVDFLTADDLMRVWQAQAGYCLYTGEKITPERADLDHIIPLNTGGTNTIGNIAFVTSQANASKGHMPLKEWCLKKGISWEWVYAGISDLHYELGLPRNPIFNDVE